MILIIKILTPILTAIGTLLVFYYSPVIKYPYTLMLEEAKIQEKKDAKKRLLARIGCWLVVISTLLQIIFIDEVLIWIRLK